MRARIAKRCTTRYLRLPLARVTTLALLSMPLMSPAESSQPAQTRWPGWATIGLEQVVAALGAAKLPLAGAEVHLLAQNTASRADPKLEVRGVEPWGERGARVRIGCEAHPECVPFYVAVDWTDADAARAALHFVPTRTASPARSSPVDERTARTAPFADRSSQGVPAEAVGRRLTGEQDVAALSRISPEVGQPDVLAGTRATLVLDGQRLHIKVPVICLEKGRAGRMIRVTALDHKQTYLAEVVDSTLLKGTL